MAGNRKSEQTKQRIIDAAKALFAEHGYQKTTVVDISKAAGLSEAALYEYFKGKEELLLTIPDLWVAELLAGLDEQMLGVQGAVNQLRKYLWWNLHQACKSPLDAKIVYLFLKTNASFMATEVYANVRKLYARLIDIMAQGQASGELRRDMDPYVARGVFVGAMDHLIIRWLLDDMGYDPFERLDETFDLLVAAFASPEYLGLRRQWRELAAAPSSPRQGKA